MKPFLATVFPNVNEPGGCLLVVRAGEVLLQECRGIADLSDNRPITSDTTFRLASVAKQFTATVILRLQQEGRLAIDDDVRRYLPEVPQLPGPLLTIRHLLQHTGGLLDYEDHIPKGTNIPLSDDDVLVVTAKHQKNYFPPGTQFRYSNTGYALLACIAQRVLDMHFPAILEEMIFHPLGMTNTVARHDTLRPDVPNRAYGYRRMPEDNSFVLVDQNLTSAVLGDGGIYCSVNDYLKWDQAYWSGKVLPLDTVKDMSTPGHLLKKGTATQTDRVWFPADMNERSVHGDAAAAGEACYYAGGKLTAPACEIPYGFGWRLETNEEGLHVAYHPGSSTGFMHCVRHVPDRDLTVLVLSNRSIAPSKELAREVEKAFLNA